MEAHKEEIRRFLEGVKKTCERYADIYDPKRKRKDPIALRLDSIRRSADDLWYYIEGEKIIAEAEGR